MEHNPRVTDTDRPGDPHGNDAGAQAQIRGRLVEEDSGHDMPIEIPEEIASQTRKMLTAIRT
jgi:hypothetical protein